MKFIILCLFISSHIFANCRLNLRGERVCIGGKVLVSKSQQYHFTGDVNDVEAHKVKSFTDYLVELNKIEEPLVIDELIGTRRCGQGRKYCVGQKVYLKANCADIGRDKVKILNIFHNGVLEIRDSILRTDERLILEECLVKFNGQ